MIKSHGLVVLQDLDVEEEAENPLIVKLECFILCLCQQPTREALLPCIKHRPDWVLALLRIGGSLTQYGADLITDALDLAPDDIKRVQVSLRLQRHATRSVASASFRLCSASGNAPNCVTSHAVLCADAFAYDNCSLAKLGITIPESCLMLQEAYGTASHEASKADAGKPSTRFFTSQLPTPLQHLSATPGDFTHAANVLTRFAQNIGSSSELRKALSNGAQDIASTANTEGLVMTPTTKVLNPLAALLTASLS